MTRYCYVSAHPRKLKDRPNVNDPPHRQLARELEQEERRLHDWLCTEMDADLARVFPARSEQRRLRELY